MRIANRLFARHAATVAAGTLLVTAGCVSREPSALDARFATPSNAISVACEPSQRAVVHPAGVNGVALPQVECVSVAAGAAGIVNYQATPAYGDPRVIPAAYTVAPPAARRIDTQSVPRYVRRPMTRSVKKSALIIGSSAGAGAGLGAVIGGKKGAAIGALLGGGGATIWDQITRRKQH